MHLSLRITLSETILINRSDSRSLLLSAKMSFNAFFLFSKDPLLGDAVLMPFSREGFNVPWVSYKDGPQRSLY